MATQKAQLLTLTNGWLTKRTCKITNDPLTDVASSQSSSRRALTSATRAQRTSTIQTNISGVMTGMER